MIFPSWFWQVLNWLSLPVMALVAGIIAWRKLHRVFPLFFLFLIVSETVGIVRFIAAQFGSASTYLYVYWISDLAWMIANFLAVYELFVLRLFARFHKIQILRNLFGFAAIGIILAAWISGLASSNRRASLDLEARVLSVVLVAMLIFFVSMMMILGRHWSKYDFGIAFGFAINNAAILINSAAWVRSRYPAALVDELPPLAFDISCLLWLYCFWSRDKVIDDEHSKPVSAEAVHEARIWESMLKTWLTPGKK